MCDGGVECSGRTYVFNLVGCVESLALLRRVSVTLFPGPISSEDLREEKDVGTAWEQAVECSSAEAK
jgi:hypothetical protein